MHGAGFRCIPSYHCTCAPGRIVTRATAYRHWRTAVSRSNHSKVVPKPIQVSYEDESLSPHPKSHESLQVADDQASIEVSSDASPNEHCVSLPQLEMSSTGKRARTESNEFFQRTDCTILCNEADEKILPYKKNDVPKGSEDVGGEDSGVVVRQDSGEVGGQDSGTLSAHSEEDELQCSRERFQTAAADHSDIGAPSMSLDEEGHDDADMENISNDLCSSTESDGNESQQLHMTMSSKLDQFMRDHTFLLGFAMKHSLVTRAMMDDLLKQYSAGYKSWNGLKKAIMGSSGLAVSSLPYCSKVHEALLKNEDGSFNQCSNIECRTNPAEISMYTYIGIWERLEARLTSKEDGPRLFKYFQDGLREIQKNKETNPKYRDFFSGDIFREAAAQLGGYPRIQHDIFLSFSTDGVSSFKSVEYSYWPCILFILNLSPTERFKLKNIMPVTIVPGPAAPGNLTSFLEPMLNELEHLRKGRSVVLWNGKVVHIRVHLLFALSDLAALSKLCNLRGYNALIPCRFCSISGIYSKPHNHVYYPSAWRRDPNGRRANLWDPKRLPLRTASDLVDELQAIERDSPSLTSAQVQDRCRKVGMKTATVGSLVLRSPLLVPFRSFPIDLMHLLFENITPHIVAIWCGDVSGCDDLSFLSHAKTKRELSARLLSAARSFSSKIRRPRAIEERGRWKATEWKSFVLELSLVVLDGLLPTHILHGWKTFVSLCELLCRWSLSDRDVEDIARLSGRFFGHYEAQYYQYLPDRVNLCRYVYHLLLHTAESIRDCGPISLLSQWPVENFVGAQNRGCHATYLFAESVMENIKLCQSTIMLCMRCGLEFPSREGETRDRPNLVQTFGGRGSTSHVLRHPSCSRTLGSFKESHNLDLRKLLCDYYQRSQEQEQGIKLTSFADCDLVRCWSRLMVEECENGYMTTFSGARDPTRNLEKNKNRPSCFVVGKYRGESTSDGVVVVENYIGRILFFLEHRFNGKNHMLFVADWVTQGLQWSTHGQLYKKGFASPENQNVFQNASVECVTTISHQVNVVEQVVSVGNRRQRRTYFVDEMREFYRSQNREQGEKKEKTFVYLRGL